VTTLIGRCVAVWLCVVAIDQQEVTADCDDMDTGLFMNSSSVNESPYFVHEPSSSSSVKKSARVSCSQWCSPGDRGLVAGGRVGRA